MRSRATHHLTYDGDRRSIVGEIKGVDGGATMVTAVSADYDEVADKTVVGYALGVRCRRCGRLVLGPEQGEMVAADKVECNLCLAETPATALITD